MTRKRYIKLMMAMGVPRNEATYLGIDPSEAAKKMYKYSEQHIGRLYAHRGCWPFNSYEEAYLNDKLGISLWGPRWMTNNKED